MPLHIPLAYIFFSRKFHFSFTFLNFFPYEHFFGYLTRPLFAFDIVSYRLVSLFVFRLLENTRDIKRYNAKQVLLIADSDE